MARYVGPCGVCGCDVDRILRPGRPRLCLPCALERSANNARRMADGTHPKLHVSIEAGNETRRQIMARKGPQYDKWRRGMIRAAEAP